MHCFREQYIIQIYLQITRLQTTPRVCVHIVDTGEGLLMFDAGNYGAQAVLIQSIWEMGFNPADVKWIILSHGHVDHFGAVNFLKNMFGTKIYMGEPDVKMFREHPELTMIQESGNCMDTLFHVDVAVKEGDIRTFGNTTVTRRILWRLWL